MTPLQKELLLHFMPAWSRRVALAERAGPEHIALPDFSSTLQSIEQSGALSLDALYVADMDAPRDPRSAVPLFSKLDGGGVAILEIRAGRSVKRALNDIATGNGLKLIYFGAPESIRAADKDTTASPLARNKHRLTNDGRRGAPIAVFQKPVFAGRETERKRLGIALTAPDPRRPFVRDRILAWRDFLLNARLAATCELLLVNDDPALDESLREFIKTELRDLRRDGALNVTLHYRRFGGARALQTVALVARSEYVFWENLAASDNAPGSRRRSRLSESNRNETDQGLQDPAFVMHCEDAFACLGAMWRLEDRKGGMPPYGPCTVVPRFVRSHATGGRKMAIQKSNPPPRGALWNQNALRAIGSATPAQISKRLLRAKKARAFSGASAAHIVRAIPAAAHASDALTSPLRLSGPSGI